VRGRTEIVVTILLLLAVLLALGLRFYQLDAQSLWYDEGFSVYLARMDVAEITERTAADIQPPLYYYLLHAWIGLVGDSEAALRGLSILFGVLTVPLMYAVGWQLFRSRWAGLLAAFLVAASPLHVWYGQEIRMYSLLTFLCLLSSYFLLLAISAEKNWQNLALWSAYTLTSIAALYTHYFAFFILAFQALYLLLVWSAAGFRPARLFVGGLLSGIVTLLAYLPWLPNLLTRYGADVSYWPGRLKLQEALLDSSLSFIGGESMPEPVGILLAIGYGLVFVLCLFALLLRAISRARRPVSGARLPILFLVLYLLVPPALILLLSYNSPKFNARYVMISHPALLLVLSGGLAALWERRASYVGNLMRGAVAAMALIFVLGVSAYANYNAFRDPVFSREDFRGVARYVRRHIAPDETVILTSGHMFPVFDYYAPAIERHLLPDSPTLDTTRTLDYGIAADLNRWLAGRSGVWVVLWQDEVVDPVGYLTTLLGQVGTEQPVERGFKGVGLRHYLLPADAQFPDSPDIAHRADFNFGNRLRLLGYDQTGDQEVTLFWEALQPLDEDYRVSLVLRDTNGQEWGRWDGRPSSYLYPTDRWRPGQVVFGRYDLAPVPGTPPGDYGLDVGVYTEADPVGLDVLDQQGAPQGKRATPGGVRLSVTSATPDEVETPHPGHYDVGGGLVLVGWDLDRYEAQPGDRPLLTLIWSVESRPQSDYWAWVFVSDEAGQVLDAGTFPPTNIWHPTGIWLPGQAWRGQNAFRLPIMASPGQARLSVQLVDASGKPLGPAVDLTTIQILPTTRSFTPPEPQVPRAANFDDRIALVGADLSATSIAPGDQLRVTLYWKALAEMDVPYTVFVHLLGLDGQVAAGHDGEPAGGTRPTTGWVPGEFITDPHEVSLPADLAPGDYVIEVGLYDAGVMAMPRLPILGDDGQTEADRVIFGPVHVR
jgi:mannosyltransferase